MPATLTASVPHVASFIQSRIFSSQGEAAIFAIRHHSKPHSGGRRTYPRSEALRQRSSQGSAGGPVQAAILKYVRPLAVAGCIGLPLPGAPPETLNCNSTGGVIDRSFGDGPRDADGAVGGWTIWPAKSTRTVPAYRLPGAPISHICGAERTCHAALF